MFFALYFQYCQSILIQQNVLHWTEISPIEMSFSGNETTLFFIRSGVPLFDYYNISCFNSHDPIWWNLSPPSNQSVYSILLKGFTYVYFQPKVNSIDPKPIEGWRIPAGICNPEQSFYLPFIPSGLFSFSLQDANPNDTCIFLSDNSNLKTDVRFTISGDSTSSSYTKTTLSGIPSPRETLKDSSRRGQVSDGIFIKLNENGSSNLEIAFRHVIQIENSFQEQYFDNCQINPVYFCFKNLQTKENKCQFTDPMLLKHLTQNCSYNWNVKEHVLMIIFTTLLFAVTIVIIIIIIIRSQQLKHAKIMLKKKQYLHQSLSTEELKNESKTP